MKHVCRQWGLLGLPLLAFAAAVASGQEKSEGRPRARDLGIKIGILPTGELNAITDVGGVRVGHRSIIKGDDVRTGVTAVLPHGGNVFQSKPPAALHVANGFGKFVGSTQIQELGVLETPIILTNTLSTFAAADALVAWSLQQKGNEDVRSVNPVVGECNDGYLNDIRGQHVRAERCRAGDQRCQVRCGRGRQRGGGRGNALPGLEGRHRHARRESCRGRWAGMSWACWCRRISTAC